jgi:hypothetical protein
MNSQSIAAWASQAALQRVHHTNTQATHNEQAGTAVSEQPLVARVIVMKESS